MILSMKIISIAFDIEQGTIKQIPDIVEYCGYVLCPSSIIFGPFMMYKDYCQILKAYALVRVSSFRLFIIMSCRCNLNSYQTIYPRNEVNTKKPQKHL